MYGAAALNRKCNGTKKDIVNRCDVRITDRVRTAQSAWERDV